MSSSHLHDNSTNTVYSVCCYSQAGLKARLAQVQTERLAVMDELCDYLSEIPPADISSFFKPGATFVQKRLALRYIMLLSSQYMRNIDRVHTCICVFHRAAVYDVFNDSTDFFFRHLYM